MGYDPARVRHGTLSYAPMRSLPAHGIDAMLDDEAVRQIVGPGATPDDLPWRLSATEDMGPDDGVHRHIVLEDGLPVGMVTFTEEWRSTAVGFWLTPEARGRGVLRTAWTELSPAHGPRFEAGCWADNAAACALLEALGFRRTEEWCHGGRMAVHWDTGRTGTTMDQDISGENACTTRT
jgi:RimJ/RimL family protein N-acetyltransferase